MPDNDLVYQQLVINFKNEFALTLLLTIGVTVVGKETLLQFLEAWTRGLIGVDTSAVSALDAERYIRAVTQVHDEIVARLDVPHIERKGEDDD